jgi:tetratricopeptide (TPR) repeat protein
MEASFRNRLMLVIFIIALQLISTGSAAAQNTDRIVKGSVKDEQGRPIRDAYLEIYRRDGCYTRPAKVDEKGEFVFILGADKPGTYYVGARAAGFQTSWRIIKPMIASEPPFIELRLKPGKEEEFIWNWKGDSHPMGIEGMNSDSITNELYRKGVRAYQGANYDQAIKLLMEALEQVPRDSWIWYYLGLARKKKGLYEEALQAFNKAIEYDDRNSKFAIEKPEVLFILGLKDQGPQAIINANELAKMQNTTTTSSCTSYITKVLINSDKNMNNSAIKAFKQAITLDPQFPELHYYFALALARNQENICEAVEEFKIYVETGSIVDFKADADDMVQAYKSSKCTK